MDTAKAVQDRLVEMARKRRSARFMYLVVLTRYTTPEESCGVHLLYEVGGRITSAPLGLYRGTNDEISDQLVEGPLCLRADYVDWTMPERDQHQLVHGDYTLNLWDLWEASILPLEFLQEETLPEGVSATLLRLSKEYRDGYYKLSDHLFGMTFSPYSL